MLQQESTSKACREDWKHKCPWGSHTKFAAFPISPSMVPVDNIIHKNHLPQTPPATLKVTNKRSIKLVTADRADMHQSPTRLWRSRQDHKKYIWKNLPHSDELQDFSGIPLGAFGQGRGFDLGADAVLDPPLASVYILSQSYSDGKIRDTHFSRWFFFFEKAIKHHRVPFATFILWGFYSARFSSIRRVFKGWQPTSIRGWIKVKAGGWINQINLAKQIRVL